MSALKKRSSKKSTPQPQPEDIVFSDEEEEFKQSTLKQEKGIKDEEFDPLENNTLAKNKRKSQNAWEDPDDKDFEMDISKVARLRKLRKNKEETVISGEEYQNRLKEYYNKAINNSHFYDWANKAVEEDEKQEESYLDSILKTNIGILESAKADTLPGEIIKLSKAAMIPIESRHSSVVQSLDFHKNNETLLSSGLDKTVKIFNISKEFETNQYELRPLKTLYCKNLPVLTAKFNCSSNEVLATGLKKYILSFDLVKETFDKSAPSFVTSRLDGKIKSFTLSPDEQKIALFGNNQYILIISAKTKQLLFELRLNSECSACCFSHDGKYLFAATEDGQLYQWDLATRKVVESFNDLGSLKTTSLDFSEDNKYLVTGNSVGIANLYGFNQLTQTLEKNIVKEFGNLTTGLDNVKINPSGEMMVLTSRWKRNAVRLVHLPTQTVFSNWPNLRTKLAYVNTACFSRNNQFMALGNDLGNVIVYNFEHYE